MKRLLVVFHSRTGGAARMAEAVGDGARDPAIEGVEVVMVRAFDTTVDDVMEADGLLLGTPENFGYMSGAMKDFFDRVYYPCLDHTRGRPYALFVRAGNDGSGAVRSIEPLASGLGWRAVADPLIARGDLDDADLAACVELGATMAAGLAFGLF